MTFDALQAAWQTADDPAPPLDPAALAALRTEAAQFDRAIRWRDRREYAAALVVALAFGWTALHAPGLARVGALLAVMGAAFVCVWMWRVQRRRPPAAPGAPTAEALRIALRRVEDQIHLLRTVAWWYLLPLLIGPLVLTGAGLAEAFAAGFPPLTTAREVGVAAVLVGTVVLILAAIGGFFWWIYRINQRAVDRDLVPLRDRLAATLHDLTDPDA